MFSVHTSSDEFENAEVDGHFEFVFEENSVREITWLLWLHCSKDKLHFQSVFPILENEKSEFPNSSGLRNVSEKLRCRDELAWMLGRRNKSAFSNFSSLM